MSVRSETRRNRLIRLGCGTLIGLGLTLSPLSGRSVERPEFKAEFLPLYESNIFRLHDDSSRVGDALLDIHARLGWKSRGPGGFRQALEAYTNLNLYRRHSARNRSAFGAVYKPKLRMGALGTLRFTVDLSQQTKDVFDDNGEILARTLAKTVLALFATHRYHLRRFSLKSLAGYEKYNYDESYDSTNARLTSYDYDFVTYAAVLGYDMSRSWDVSLSIETEKRFYEERRTLARDKKSSQVRSFRRNELRLDNDIRPAPWLRAVLSLAWARRTENFENFYGYDWTRQRLKVLISPWAGHESSLVINSRIKDYPIYYTVRTGTAHTVHIKYFLFEFEHRVRLSARAAAYLHIENRNTVSNDFTFDYHSSFVGMGVTISR